jgi:hypothetical protein
MKLALPREAHHPNGLPLSPFGDQSSAENRLAPDDTPERNRSAPLDLVESARQRRAPHRRVLHDARLAVEMLNVGIDHRGLGVMHGVVQEGLEIGWITQIFLLPIAEEILAELAQQPVEIPGPAKPARLPHQLEARIVGMAAADLIGSLIAAFDRNEHPHICEALRADRLERLGHIVPTLKDGDGNQDGGSGTGHGISARGHVSTIIKPCLTRRSSSYLGPSSPAKI